MNNSIASIPIPERAAGSGGRRSHTRIATTPAKSTTPQNQELDVSDSLAKAGITKARGAR